MECSGRNPCCVGVRGTSGWIMFSIRHSVILDGVQSSVMGLSDEGVVGSLFGFSCFCVVSRCSRLGSGFRCGC